MQQERNNWLLLKRTHVQRGSVHDHCAREASKKGNLCFIFVSLTHVHHNNPHQWRWSFSRFLLGLFRFFPHQTFLHLNCAKENPHSFHLEYKQANETLCFRTFLETKRKYIACVYWRFCVCRVHGLFRFVLSSTLVNETCQYSGHICWPLRVHQDLWRSSLKNSSYFRPPPLSQQTTRTKTKSC